MLQICFKIKVNRIWLGKQVKVNNDRLHQRCPDDITTPPLLQASQAVHGADFITTSQFMSQVISVRICGCQVDTLFYYSRLLCPIFFPLTCWDLITFSINVTITDSGDPFFAHTPQMFIPVFTIIEFIGYLGWIKVAETLLNPWGDDDEDFQINYLIDRNFQVRAALLENLSLSFLQGICSTWPLNWETWAFAYHIKINCFTCRIF